MQNEDSVAVGRQGIYDAAGLIGYELLFRRVGPLTGASRLGEGQMTASVVYGALSIGLSRVAGDNLLFCDADRGVLSGRVPLLLPPERTVLQVAEDVVVDEAVVAGCHSLIEAGYGLALDAFRGGRGHEQLLPLARIVKIDLLLTPPDQLDDLVRLAREHDTQLLVERVEELDHLSYFHDLGFELFQGHVLDKPTIVEGRTLAPSSAGRVSSALQVLGTEGDFDEIEAVLMRDPALAHQVMLLASLGRPGEPRRSLNSIRDALVLAGTTQIRRWLALLLVRPTGSSSDSRDAFLTTLIRARVCELTARRLGLDPALAYTAGLLSAMDGLLHVPREELADKLALSDELRSAAFGGTTPLGRLVGEVADYPHRGAMRPALVGEGQVNTIDIGLGAGIDGADLDAAFAAAFGWAIDAVDALD